jgi:hypothetical protein
MFTGTKRRFVLCVLAVVAATLTTSALSASASIVPSSPSTALDTSFDLVVHVRNSTNKSLYQDEVFVVKDYKAAGRTAGATWAIQAPKSGWKARMFARFMTAVEGEPSGRVSRKGFYRVSGTLESEERCGRYGCSTFNYLKVTSAKRLWGMGSCAEKHVFSGSFWVSVCYFNNEFSVFGGNYSKERNYPPAKALFSEVKITKDRRSTVVPSGQTTAASFDNGPVTFAVRTPGKARCRLKVGIVMDMQNDGDGEKTANHTFSFDC